MEGALRELGDVHVLWNRVRSWHDRASEAEPSLQGERPWSDGFDEGGGRIFRAMQVPLVLEEGGQRGRCPRFSMNGNHKRNLLPEKEVRR